MKGELSDVQAGFQRGRGTRNQIVNICWIREKAREFQKNICVCFIDYTKAFDFSAWVIINWKIFEEMGIPDHLTCLLRNLYPGQEATDRTRHRMARSQLGKEYDKAVYSTLLNIYAQYIMQNARLDESQAGIKITGRNINFRYADDTTLMAESEEELKNLLMKVKEGTEKVGLKLNIKRTNN